MFSGIYSHVSKIPSSIQYRLLLFVMLWMGTLYSLGWQFYIGSFVN